MLEELYVGATNRRLKKLLAKFESDFEKINRLLVPNQTDWTTCGQVLSAIGQKYGFEQVTRPDDKRLFDCNDRRSLRFNGDFSQYR